MNKQLLSLLFLSLILVSVYSQDENCRDHPWAKRSVLAKFFKIWTRLGKDIPTDLQALTTLFDKESTNTNLADKAIVAADFPNWPAGWSETKSCCTKENYALLLTIPNKLVELFKDAHSVYLR